MVLGSSPVALGKINRYDGSSNKLSRAGINALAFNETNYTFSKSGREDSEAECKHHDLAEVKLQNGEDKWKEDRLKQLPFIN